MQEHTPFGMLASLIRQKQAEEGNTPCFATAASKECANKECCLHHECAEDTRESRPTHKFS